MQENVPAPAPAVVAPPPGEYVKGNPATWHIFSVLLICIEIAVVIIIGCCFGYPPSVFIINTPNIPGNNVLTAPTFSFIYPFYQDVHVMVFVGFALILMYLTRFGWSAAGVHLITAAVVIQCYLIFRALWLSAFNESWDKIALDFIWILTADYCVASVAITWLALAGRYGAFQMVVLGVIQAFLYSLNEFINYYSVHTYDIGGGMTVFLFGGMFALGAALLTPANRERVVIGANAISNYYSTLFALLGTLFLWVFFPSFNAARVNLDLQYGLQYGNQSHRAVMNTLLSLTGSVVSTFIWTSVFREGRFDIEHIMKATLAGGVIISSSADLCIDPFAAVLIGCWGAFMSILFFNWFHERMRYHDTFGVTHLFVWPGIWAGVISAIFIGTMDDDKIGTDVPQFFWNLRTQSLQGGLQIATLAISLGIGFVGGLIGGLLTKFCGCYSPHPERYYEEVDIWFPEKDEVFVR